MENAIAYYSSPIGILRLEANESGICSVSLCGEEQRETAADCETLRLAQRQLDAYFQGKLREFSVPLSLHGTDFQLRAWEQLLKIPCGETRTYGEIAAAMGNPAACRAVGMACNKNPVMIFVPCHRVIGSSGKLTGFACGLDVKVRLLELERGK